MKIVLRFFSCYIFFSLAAPGAHAQKGKSYTIKADIEGLQDGTNVFLLTNNEKGAFNSLKDTVGRTTAQKGKFQFSGKVDNPARFHMILIQNQQGNLQLVLGNEKVTIKGKIDEWTKAEVKGSKFTEEKNAFSKEMAVLQLKNPSPEEIANSRKKFIETHTNSAYAPFIIMLSGLGSNEKQAAYDRLTDEAKNSYYGKKLPENIALTKTREGVKEGAIIPDFKVKTPDGQVLSVHEIAAKSKYTLIDFWASWCSPCRAAIPHIKEVYDEFNSKGFNVLGVSVDKNESDWKKAVEEDKAPWVHGLQGEDRASSNIFDVQAIPGYILIDNTGKLVSFSAVSGIKGFGPDISSKELQKTIKDLITLN